MRRVLPLAFLLVAALPVSAGLTVGVDIETLNALLPSLAPSRVEVPLSADNHLEIEIRNLHVNGFEPNPDPALTGHVLTSLDLLVPALGLEIPLEPRLTVAVLDGGRTLELRFVEVKVALPLAGKLDVARFMPPLTFPVENVFLLEGTRGPVEVTSRLRRVEMGRQVIRFELELEAAAP